ncbi:hypothetical protein [Caproiciproducens sp.]
MAKSNEEKMLELLAFGKVTDTVKLLTEMQKEKPDPAVFDKLELRNIHTIRCTSTGGFEVEFYDRFKAMLTLRGLRVGDGVPSFYSALQSAAAGLSQEKEEQEYLSRHE